MMMMMMMMMGLIVATTTTTAVVVKTDRPIIGILTQPSDRKTSNEEMSSYLAASYVKWAEASGARVVPIHYDAPLNVTESLFYQINGVIFPGGGASLDNTTSNLFYSTALRIFELAEKVNKNQEEDSFPIHGTCLGFQLLSILGAGGQENVLCDGCYKGVEGIPMKLNFTQDARDSRLFRNMSDVLFEALHNENLTSNEHHSGVEPSMFLSNDLLFKTFTVLSTNVDPQTGREFVSTIESKTRPYTGTQWHPEKNNFEWSTNVDLPHSSHAVEISQFVANDFVSRARMSTHRFRSEETESESLIYNDVQYLEKDPDGYFAQIYLWPNGYVGF
jgi:gamma-glutamyl hydrolase